MWDGSYHLFDRVGCLLALTSASTGLRRREPLTSIDRSGAITSFIGGTYAAACVVLTLGMAPAVFAQSEGPSDPIECLERQRELDRQAQAAAQAGQRREAARLVGQAVRLPHVFAAPFSKTGQDPRQSLIQRALRLRGSYERARAAVLLEQVRAHWGEPCRSCQAIGCEECNRCGGSGVYKRRVRRKWVSEDCDPWVRCRDCGGAGRTRSAGVSSVLTAVDESAQTLARLGDPLSAFRKAFKIPPDLTTWGLEAKYDEGENLRSLVPSVPFHPDSLSAKIKRQFKGVWKGARPLERLDFARGALIEALAFRDAVSYLDLPKKERAQGRPRNARLVAWAELLIDPESFQGQWVQSDVIIGSGKRETDFFFSDGQLLLKSEAPSILPFHYTVKGRLILEQAQRLRTVDFLSSMVRTYPKRSLQKFLDQVSSGDEITIIGRVLARQRGRSSHLFEIWDAKPKGGK